MAQNQFLLETNGYCFICLKKPSAPTPIPQSGEQNGIDGRGGASSSSSLQNICNYVKTYLIDVSVETGSLGPSLVDDLPRLAMSEVRGFLCEDCGQLSNQFSRKMLELAAVRVQLNSCLKSLHRKMLVNLDNGNDNDQDQDMRMRLETFKNEMLGRIETRNHFGIVEGFRNKIIDGSKTTLDKKYPLVIMQSLPVPAAPVGTQEEVMATEGGAYQRRIITTDRISRFPLSLPQLLEEWDSPDPTSFTLDSNTGMLKCKRCSNDFRGPSSFNKHYRSIHNFENYPIVGVGDHPTPPPATPSSSATATATSSVGNGRKFGCELCPRRFTHESTKLHHMRRSHGVVSTRSTSEYLEAGPSPASTTNSDHPDPNNNRRSSTSPIPSGSKRLPNGVTSGKPQPRFICQICKEELPDKNNLLQHYLLLHKGNRVKCKNCPMVFPEPRYRNQHMKFYCQRTEKKGNAIKCHTCQKMFPTQESLKGHQAKLHNNQRNSEWACELCPETFLDFPSKELHNEQFHKRPRQLAPNVLWTDSDLGESSASTQK